MANHSSILAWKIPWMEEPGRLQSTGSQRVKHDWGTSLSFFLFSHILSWALPSLRAVMQMSLSCPFDTGEAGWKWIVPGSFECSETTGVIFDHWNSVSIGWWHISGSDIQVVTACQGPTCDQTVDFSFGREDLFWNVYQKAQKVSLTSKHHL